MLTSEKDAIRAVELAIMACEGTVTVDGIRYAKYHDAEIARQAIAEKAVAQSTLLRRWIAILPPCPWCGESISTEDARVEIAGVQVHSTTGRPCAGEYAESRSDCYAAPRGCAQVGR